MIAPWWYTCSTCNIPAAAGIAPISHLSSPYQGRRYDGLPITVQITLLGYTPLAGQDTALVRLSIAFALRVPHHSIPTLPRWAERSTLPPHYVFLPPFCLMDAKSCPHRIGCPLHRVHTEWQSPLSGVHSIMMEKLAWPGEGGECTAHPPSFTIFIITFKVVVYASAERADMYIILLFLLYPYMYSVVHCKQLICLHSQS